MESEEKSVGAIVCRERNGEVEYLILDRNDKEGEFWEYPKGHVEEGESELETLKRELEEETGIKKYQIINGFREVISYKSRSSGKQRTFVYYLILTTEKISLSKEHKNYNWLKYDKILKEFDYKDMIEITVKANEKLEERREIPDKLNFVIPCRNVADKVRGTVESIIDKVNDKEYKIILVENGSTDNTKEELQRLSNEYSNVKNIESEPGKIKALKKGFEQFNDQEPIFCMDSDVILKNNNLELALEQFRKHLALLIVGGVPIVKEDELSDEERYLNLSGLFPMTKKVIDTSYSFDQAFEDPQDAIRPVDEVKLKPFFHGRIFVIRNKTVVPDMDIKGNVPEDILWNRYIFNKHGRNTIRILQKLQVYYKPYKSLLELAKYRKRIKKQVIQINNEYPEFADLNNSFKVYRDKALIMELSKETREQFEKEEFELSKIMNKELNIEWYGDQYDDS